MAIGNKIQKIQCDKGTHSTQRSEKNESKKHVIIHII